MRAAALRKLFSLAQNDPRILLAVSDVAAEILAPFKENMPQRLFVEGIAENHLVGMAAGLSKKNNIVFINTIASFLSKRAFEAIAVNLCLENANVKMLAQGGGLVYGEQGSTHHALEDISIMRSLPNMSVMAPCDTHQTEQAVELATKISGPVYIRLSKGSFPVISAPHTLVVGEPICFSKPGRVAFISTGITTQTALEASASFPESGVINVPILKPFPEQKILALISDCELVVTIEEHSPIGGLSSCLASILAAHSRRPRLLSISLKDDFVRDYGKQEELLKLHGLDTESVVRRVRENLRDKPFKKNHTDYS